MTPAEKFKDFILKIFNNRIFENETDIFRVYAFCGTLFPPIICFFIFDGNIFPFWVAVAFPLLFGLSFILSLFHSYFESKLKVVILGLLNLLVQLGILFAFINGFTVKYSVGLFLGIVTGSLLMVRHRQLLFYIVTVSISLSLSLTFASTIFIDRAYFILFLIVYFLIVHFLMRQHLKNQEKLKESESLLSRVFDNSNDGILLLDYQSLGLIRANRKFLNLMAVELNDISNLFDYNQFMRLKLSVKEIEHIRETIKTNGFYVFTRECKSAQERVFWARISCSVIISQTGRQLLVQISDIDSSRNKEEKLLKDKLVAENYLDLTSGIIVVIDKNQKIALLNKYGCELYQATEEDIIGKDYFDLFIPADEREMVRAFHKEVFTTQFINEAHEGRVIIVSGDIRIISWRNGLLYDENGAISGTISYGIDVTEERKREESAKLVESRLHNLISNLPNAVFYETGGGREFKSDNFSDLLGYPTKEFLENPELFNTIIHPDDFNLTKKQIKIWQANNLKGVLRLEFRVKHANGNYLWLEDFVSAVMKDGKLDYLAGIMIDISERKQIEIELRQSEERFRLISTGAPIGVYRLSETGVPLFVNEAVLKITGISKENFSRKSFQEIIYPADAARIELQANQMLENKNDFFAEFRIKPVNSSELKWVKAKTRSFMDGDSHKGWVVILEDITDLKNSSERLLESEQRFRLLSDATNEGVFLSFEETIIDTNQQFVKMLGCVNKEELIGLKTNEYVADEFLDLVLQNHETKFSRTYTIKIRKPNGNLFTAEINEAIVPYYGKPVRISVVNDVTERNRIANEINETTERFRSLINFIPLGLVLLDVTNKLTFANNAAARLLGISSTKFNQEEIQQFIVPDYLASFNLLIDKIRNDSSYNPIEVKVLKADRKLFDAEFNGRIVKINEEQFVQLTFQDISLQKMFLREQMRAQIAEESNVELEHEIQERRKVEVKLIAEQVYKKSLIESSIDVIISTNITNNILEFNNAALKVFGYELDEVFQKPVSKLFQQLDIYNDWLNQLKTNGQFQGEVELIKKDGKLVQSYITSSRIVIEGNVVGTMSVIRDITEQKRKADELRESEARFRVIYNQAFIGIARISKVGRFILTNKRVSEILGYSIEELYRLAFFQLIHKDDITDVLAKWDELSIGETDNFSTEHRFVHKLGYEIFVNVSVSLVRKSQGKPQYFIAAFEDITQRKEAELQIKEALKEKELLVKEIHHRVKNNMQVISSILNLQCLYIEDERTVEMLKESQNRIKSMSFIHESLYQSKNLSHINFTEYIRNLAANLNQSSNLYRNDVKLEFELDEVLLVLDLAIPLGLIINELVTNAFKYAFNERLYGVVKIQLKEIDRKGYLLSVSDDGKGLPATIDIRNTESLGLQLVCTLVEQIGGELSLANEKGAKFAIKFYETQIKS